MRVRVHEPGQQDAAHVNALRARVARQHVRGATHIEHAAVFTDDHRAVRDRQGVARQDVVGVEDADGLGRCSSAAPAQLGSLSQS